MSKTIVRKHLSRKEIHGLKFTIPGRAVDFDGVTVTFERDDPYLGVTHGYSVCETDQTIDGRARWVASVADRHLYEMDFG